MADDLVKRARDWDGCWPSNEVERLVPAMADRIEALTAERDAALRNQQCFQRTTRAHWEALCAMRNSINEYIEMPNTDSGPLFSPEDGPIYSDIAERVVAAIRAEQTCIEALTAERDALRAEVARLRMIIQARDAIDAAEPSAPPATDIPKRAFMEARHPHDVETHTLRATEGDS